MRYLLDTHAFLWLDSEPEQLPAAALAVCKAPSNLLYVSAASLWEIQIKQQLGKLELDVPLEALLETQRQVNGIEVLGIELAHIYGLQRLPHHHRDPFDRLLISQAQIEGLTLISKDGVFSQYGVALCWQ